MHVGEVDYFGRFSNWFKGFKIRMKLMGFQGKKEAIAAVPELAGKDIVVGRGQPLPDLVD